MEDEPFFGWSHGVCWAAELVVVPCHGADGEKGGCRASGGVPPLRSGLGAGARCVTLRERISQQLNCEASIAKRRERVEGNGWRCGWLVLRRVERTVVVLVALRAAPAMRADRRLDLANMANVGCNEREGERVGCGRGGRGVGGIAVAAERSCTQIPASHE